MPEEYARVVGNASSSNWVVEMEKMIEDTSPSAEKVRWKKTSIYRVPEWHKDLSNRKAYRPWLVSLGPFHHGETDLLPMEEHKRRAVLHLVKRARRPVREFVVAIEAVTDKLLDAYQGLDEKWRGENRGRFVEMMVTDGCFFLEVKRTFKLAMEDEADDDYASNDPVFSKHGLHYLFGAIQVDMVVIENQLPLLVLERLVAVQHGTPPSPREINKMVQRLLVGSQFPVMHDLGLHPLDIYHNSFCGGRRQHKESDEGDFIIPTAVELSEAGVHLTASNTPWVHDVNFENGTLSIPVLFVDEITEKKFLNLTVFEQLYSDAGRDFTNYLFFMDHIIDSERDVALLRSKGIIKSFCSSDKEVAVLFNNLTKGTTSNANTKLREVKHKVNAHCARRRNRWRSIFVQAYLSNPWVFISLVAAVTLLVATLLQTVYTVVPYYTKN